MTTIAGYQGDGFAILGADSQITDGDKRIISPSTPKIVKVGRYLLAVSGDCRPGDILMYNWKPPTYDGSDPVKFMGKKVIPSIITAFKAEGYEYGKDGVSFSYLLAFDANIFEIGEDLSFSQSHNGIYGVGSGSPYALGYLSAVVGNPSTVDWAKEKVLKSIKIASTFDINTCAPFQIEVQKA